MDNQGVLAVISGFSGAGKGTLMRALLERYDNYALSISATTRAPREGEVDGREYFFKTREEFEQMIEHDELVEYAQYVGNYYGTPKEYVFSNLKAGKDVLLEIEIQGALKIKKKFPEAVLIFVTPPSAGELRNRLAGRGTETPEKIAARLSRAAEESKQMDDYDFILGCSLFHRNQRAACLFFLIHEDIFGVHALFFIKIRSDLSEYILTHLGHQRHIRAGPVGCYRLIGSLSAGSHHKGTSHDGLPRYRKRLGSSCQIHYKASEYNYLFTHALHLR